MSFARQREPLLLGALLISILLHLLLGLLLAFLPSFGPERISKEPMFVEVVPPRKRSPPRQRELDTPRQPPPVQRRVQPAKRLGPDDRVAPRETAPEGLDDEDRQPSTRAPRSVARAAPPSSPPAPPAVPAEPSVTTGEASPRPTTPQGEFSPTQGPDTGRPQTSLKDLLTLAPTTKARIESDWRRKMREGVEKGDTVWLDTEQDLLISFFKRFRDNIYNVWNYPERARLREEQGQCLLRIVVSREGTIDDVQLLESSGSRDLDDEAVRAVRKGQPYGPLPSAYPHPKLNIMAYFRYNLSKGFKYPGRITGE
jgi:protein TonB